MKAVVLFSLYVIFCIASYRGLRVEGKKYETLLLDTILKDYDKRSRPVKDDFSAIVINFSIFFQQILQVDEKHQVITINIWRTLYWKDEFLNWNPENYGNISQISILRSQIWTPFLLLYNSASYADKQIETHITNIVCNDGRVTEVLPMLVKSKCEIDVKWFPFDEQKCLLIFGSWSISSKELRLELSDNAADTSEFVGNGEWKLLGATATRNVRTYSSFSNESYVIITYTVHLKRRAFYYFFNLLVPCGLIGFLAILNFTLPPESGEKLPLGATILFSLIVFLNMIGETMPANSDAVPLLGTYFNCVMFTIALSVVSTIVVNLNLNAVNPKEVEGRSRKLLLCWLPWILRIKPPPNIVDQMKVGDTIAMDLNCRTSSDKIWKQQWKFIAVVVDRLCLIFSLLFTCFSVTVFLIYAF